MGLAKGLKIPQLDSSCGSGPFMACQVTTALYTYSGGLCVEGGKVLNQSGQPIAGLFAAGEVTHFQSKQVWSVPGIPLLHAIRSGRAAGAACAAEGSFQAAENRTDLRNLILKSLKAEMSAPE